jgi:hypothetical protein
MLSFKNGRPIAKIINAPRNKNNNKIIRINDLNDNKEKEIEYDDIYDLITEDEIFKLSGKRKLNLLEYANYPSIESRYKEIDQKEIILNNGEIVPYPNTNTRDVIYVAGPSGSGKSTWCALYITQYKKQFPKNKVLIFSRVESDPAIDFLKPTRVIINDELVNDRITAEELSNSLVVFDDCDTLVDKNQREAILELRDDLLETGRHTSTYMISTAHLLMNYKSTRSLLNEATLVIVYPQSGSSYHINRFMKIYAGMDKKQIERALRLPSRWVGISKVFPMYIIYSSGVYLLNK